MIGDRLLICSDGLSDLVEDQLIADLLYTRDLDDAAIALVAAALDRGGRDNVTCVIGEVETGPLIRRHGSFVGACFPDNLIDPTPVRLGVRAG
jgi:protein phosphatase